MAIQIYRRLRKGPKAFGVYFWQLCTIIFSMISFAVISFYTPYTWLFLVTLIAIPIIIYCISRLQKNKPMNHFFDWFRFISQKGVWVRGRDEIEALRE